MPINSFTEVLTTIERESYRFRTNKIFNVDSGINLATAFTNLSNQEREKAQLAISNRVAFKLMVLSGYMAELAIDKRSKLLITTGLLMHIIEGFRIDYRENFRYLVLLYQASVQINVKLSDILDEVLEQTNENSRFYLNEFVRRDYSLNKIDLFGLQQRIKDGSTEFIALPDRFSRQDPEL